MSVTVRVAGWRQLGNCSRPDGCGTDVRICQIGDTVTSQQQLTALQRDKSKPTWAFAVAATEAATEAYRLLGGRHPGWDKRLWHDVVDSLVSGESAGASRTLARKYIMHEGPKRQQRLRCDKCMASRGQVPGATVTRTASSSRQATKGSNQSPVWGELAAIKEAFSPSATS